MAKHYTKEFKEQAVKLVVEEGMTRNQVGHDLGVHHSAVGRWVLEWQRGGAKSFPGKGKLKPENEEIHRLEKENRRLRMERDILKKAIGYFSEIKQ